MEAAKLLIDLAKQSAEKKVLLVPSWAQVLRRVAFGTHALTRIHMSTHATLKVHPLRVKKLYVLAAFEVTLRG